MKTSVAFALAAASAVQAHTTFQSFIINGKEDPTGVQVPSNGNNPITDVTSTAMICNGGKMGTDFVDFKAGSDITFQWHHNNPATIQGDADEPIAASHQGPIMVYMAKASTKGEGAVWTKIFEDGMTNGKFAVQKFIDNKGKITITLPNVEDGEYLIRPEMIGLHEGNRAKGAQFYNGCGQIKVSGGSVALPASGVDMTKAYSATDPGVLFDMYSGAKSYTIPGPKVWDGASTGSGSAPSNPTPTKPAASATPAPTKTATPVASPTAAPAQSAAPAPSTGSGNTGGSDNGSSLPETFTISQFISWLQKQTGTKARRHARDIAL